ncbi:hypothetical protein HYH02_007232 [Chlamydomonas schloesseri]|uniref:Uncharacterized protein n=1 Tax=Chlamydomonas schloesseri TaxID=2026947 RepID=A0A835WHX1_9CHLO|nr:hypothetical protein HYH02_007232 [Chlamydomonas schloesseri]|eukprot:KAG2447775.1 hypothetical protein HYH02_007232 [Chlamydomonas schloesseri]
MGPRLLPVEHPRDHTNYEVVVQRDEASGAYQWRYVDAALEQRVAASRGCARGCALQQPRPPGGATSPDAAAEAHAQALRAAALGTAAPASGATCVDAMELVEQQPQPGPAQAPAQVVSPDGVSRHRTPPPPPAAGASGDGGCTAAAAAAKLAGCDARVLGGCGHAHEVLDPTRRRELLRATGLLGQVSADAVVLLYPLEQLASSAAAIRASGTCPPADVDLTDRDFVVLALLPPPPPPQQQQQQSQHPGSHSCQHQHQHQGREAQEQPLGQGQEEGEARRRQPAQQQQQQRQWQQQPRPQCEQAVVAAGAGGCGAARSRAGASGPCSDNDSDSNDGDQQTEGCGLTGGRPCRASSRAGACAGTGAGSASDASATSSGCSLAAPAAGGSCGSRSGGGSGIRRTGADPWWRKPVARGCRRFHQSAAGAATATATATAVGVAAASQSPHRQLPTEVGGHCSAGPPGACGAGDAMDVDVECGGGVAQAQQPQQPQQPQHQLAWCGGGRAAQPTAKAPVAAQPRAAGPGMAAGRPSRSSLDQAAGSCASTSSVPSAPAAPVSLALASGPGDCGGNGPLCVSGDGDAPMSPAALPGGGLLSQGPGQAVAGGAATSCGGGGGAPVDSGGNSSGGGGVGARPGAGPAGSAVARAAAMQAAIATAPPASWSWRRAFAPQAHQQQHQQHQQHRSRTQQQQRVGGPKVVALPPPPPPWLPLAPLAMQAPRAAGSAAAAGSGSVAHPAAASGSAPAAAAATDNGTSILRPGTQQSQQSQSARDAVGTAAATCSPPTQAHVPPSRRPATGICGSPTATTTATTTTSRLAGSAPAAAAAASTNAPAPCAATASESLWALKWPPGGTEPPPARSQLPGQMPPPPPLQQLQAQVQRVAAVAVCRQLRDDVRAAAVASGFAAATQAGAFKPQRRSATKTAAGATPLLTSGYTYAACTLTSVPGPYAHMLDERHGPTRAALVGQVLRLVTAVLARQHPGAMQLLRGHSRGREYHGPGTGPFCTLSLTHNYHNRIHIDQDDPPLSFITWWLEGGGGGWQLAGGAFRLASVGVRFTPLQGTTLLLNTTLIYHGTEGCSSSSSSSSSMATPATPAWQHSHDSAAATAATAGAGSNGSSTASASKCADHGAGSASSKTAGGGGDGDGVGSTGTGPLRRLGSALWVRESVVAADAAWRAGAWVAFRSAHKRPPRSFTEACNYARSLVRKAGDPAARRAYILAAGRRTDWFHNHCGFDTAPLQEACGCWGVCELPPGVLC